MSHGSFDFKKKPNQKLIYSKDAALNSLNSTADLSLNSIHGIFKSNSSLAKSLCQTQGNIKMTLNDSTYNDYISTMSNKTNNIVLPSLLSTKKNNFPFSFSSSAKQIISSNISINNPASQIRNLTHFYDRIDIEEKSYKLFSELKSERRNKHLNAIDEYNRFRISYINSIDINIKRKINELKERLDKTKFEINSQFLLNNDDLITFTSTDIHLIEMNFFKILSKRKEDITNTKNHITGLHSECIKIIVMKISELKKNLIEIGFMLEFECEKIKQNKTEEKENYFKELDEINQTLFNEITSSEEIIQTESQTSLNQFIKRWKNEKLKKYIRDIKGTLTSVEFVDNSERYLLIKNLKNDQERIYDDRLNLIQKMFKLSILSNVSTVEIYKQLEEIYNQAQVVYDIHTHKLVDNSEMVLKKSLQEIEKFISQVKSISALTDPTLYENYQNISTIDELIDLEITPIINSGKISRKEYISKIIAYLDDYDEFTHNICNKLIGIYSMIGLRNDEHKKILTDSEKHYLLDIAKAADDNDDKIFNLEESLKKIIVELQECIDKPELDIRLDNAFKILNELEIEYRLFFDTVETLLNSHDSRVVNIFQSHETKILEIFGIMSINKSEIIKMKRNTESEFLSKRKEAELIVQEEKALEDEKKNLNKKGPGAGAVATVNKKNLKSQAKKGDNTLTPNLIPSRGILDYRSKLNSNYLIDFTITELVRHLLRNVIHNSEDDILGINHSQKNEKEKENDPNNKDTRLQSDMNGPDSMKSSKENKLNSGNTKLNLKDTFSFTTAIDFLKQFDPYNSSCLKEFKSPVSDSNLKLLSEENIFSEEYLTGILSSKFECLTEKIKISCEEILELNKTSDNDRREEYLSNLDIRLKSLAPRKGKVEVEEYDKRLNELHKHYEKFQQHQKSIMERNSSDREKNGLIINEITKAYEELYTLYENLLKGMNEEQSLKGLDSKHKKFKSIFYDLTAKLTETEVNLRQFSKINPENLIRLNENFVKSLKGVSDKGTYSTRELIFYTEKVDKINTESIIKEMNDIEISNHSKLNNIRTNMNNLLEKIEKSYFQANENILAKDAAGKRFGAPRRVANDVIINMKMKCNQAIGGLENLLSDLKLLVGDYEKMKGDETYILKNSLPIEIRKQILIINNCLFNYGKYIEAFRPSHLSSYCLIRINNTKETVDTIDITNKIEQDEDEKRSKAELAHLGLLSGFILGDVKIDKEKSDKSNKGDNFPNYNNELNSIEDKIKSECLKLYTGEFAKLINNTNKVPLVLLPYIQNYKTEMENFRIKCVRDLRTFSQNLFEFSLHIPSKIMEFIYLYTTLSKQIKYKQIINEFESLNVRSEKIKKDLNSSLGPYLANPYYINILNEKSEKENERSRNFSAEIDCKQFDLIQNEEKYSDEYCTRIINNFESLICLFDNFIFEEEYITLGDEEYFKDNRDFNFLLKLNSEKKSNLNLESKRTFKKIYVGIDKNKLKVNFFLHEKFKNFCLNYVMNNEEKIKILEADLKKENLSKNIIGLNLKNNKNLFVERNINIKKYCDNFKNDLEYIIEFFDKFRNIEHKYKKRWEETLKELRTIMK